MFGLLLPCRKVDRYVAYLHSAIKNDIITIRLCLLGAQDETFSPVPWEYGQQGFGTEAKPQLPSEGSVKCYVLDFLHVPRKKQKPPLLSKAPPLLAH